MLSRGFWPPMGLLPVLRGVTVRLVGLDCCVGLAFCACVLCCGVGFLAPPVVPAVIWALWPCLVSRSCSRSRSSLGWSTGGLVGAFWGHFGDIMGTFWGRFDLLGFSRASIFYLIVFTVDLVHVLVFCFRVFFSLKKPLLSVFRKAITWGQPLIIATYNESIGLPFLFQYIHFFHIEISFRIFFLKPTLLYPRNRSTFFL